MKNILHQETDLVNATWLGILEIKKRPAVSREAFMFSEFLQIGRCPQTSLHCKAQCFWPFNCISH